MSDLTALAGKLKTRFGESIVDCTLASHQELTIEIKAAELLHVCQALRDENDFLFEQLIDLCGVDYAGYGQTEWATEEATSEGFSRGVEREHLDPDTCQWAGGRFAVVYHLLSLTHNHRLRVRAYTQRSHNDTSADAGVLDSVIGVWAAADWYEREAFDLFGIVGHPMRKDFPTSGYVEVRYDETQKRVIYQPVSIEPRVLVPRVIRHDSRYDKTS